MGYRRFYYDTSCGVIGSNQVLNFGVTTTDQFINFRVKDTISNSGHFYGWVRFNFYACDAIDIRDYAYQDLNDIPIYTGDGMYGPKPSASPDSSKFVLVNQSVMGDPTDLQFSFTPSSDSLTPKEYKVMIVKSTHVKTASDTFNIAQARALGPESYLLFPHDTTGNPVNVQFPANFKDSDGEMVVAGVEYKILVLNVPDGFHSNALSLSDPSDGFILQKEVGIPEDLKNEAKLLVFDGNSVIYVGDKIIREIQVYDLEGRMIQKSNSGQCYLGQLNKGMYVVHGELKDGSVLRRKVILD